MKALLCVPNVSEGKDLAVVEKIVNEIRSVKGAMIIDYSSDADHNRSVITFVGPKETIAEAAFRGIA